ncbi:MAG TPA: hypothetical protein VGM37_21565 [Armatimonadota bacterium]|jgi:hypothetical protein
MTTTPWKCPQCGYDNAVSAALCNLCGEKRASPEPAAAPASVRFPAESARPAADGLQPQRLPDGPVKRLVFDSPRGAGLQPPARRILNPGPSAPNRPPASARAILAGVDNWTRAEFVALLPLSLIVYALPGGVRHPRARLALHILALALLIAFLLCLPMLASLFSRFIDEARAAMGD